MSYYAFEFEGVPKHGHTLFLLVISLYWRRDGVTRVEVTAEVFVVGSVDTSPSGLSATARFSSSAGIRLTPCKVKR